MEQKSKPSQAAATGRARRQKRRQRASKGDRGETKGHKLGKQGGGDKFERAQTV